jgi:hypothetical protein
MKGHRWTEGDLKKLKRDGKIRGYKAKAPTEKTPAGRIVSKLFKKKSAEKNWMAETLLTWCNAQVLVLQEEYRFHDQRKWRFDWCIEYMKVAFEYEGIYSEQSRHTNQKGYSKDTEKYNAAAALGWRVYRYTASTYKNLENDLKCMSS